MRKRSAVRGGTGIRGDIHAGNTESRMMIFAFWWQKPTTQQRFEANNDERASINSRRARTVSAVSTCNSLHQHQLCQMNDESTMKKIESIKVCDPSRTCLRDIKKCTASKNSRQSGEPFATILARKPRKRQADAAEASLLRAIASKSSIFRSAQRTLEKLGSHKAKTESKR